MLLKTVGSCEGKDKILRRGLLLMGEKLGRKKGGGELKCEEKRRRDHRAQGISILIDLCL